MGQPLLNPTRRRAMQQREAAKGLQLNKSQLVQPIPSPFIRTGGTGSSSYLDYAEVTQATFDGTSNSRPWETNLDRLVHRGLSLKIPWSNPGGVASEIRLALVTPSGTLYTSAVATTAGTTGRTTFRWLHDADPWEGQDLPLYVEARRTSGSFVAHIGPPIGGACQVDPTDCTTTGL